ncbi:MAG TPA: hypothetical protein VGA28_10355 [Desulfurivibrionaceae bacterium]
MPVALAMARVKVKKKCHAFLGGPEHNTDVGHEISKAGLGVILCAGAIIGLSGFFFLVGGLIKSGGITGFVKGWLTAFTGI